MQVKKTITPLDYKQKVLLATVTIKVKFVPVNDSSAHCCVNCVFFNLGDCTGVPCTRLTRNDKQNGYFQLD